MKKISLIFAALIVSLAAMAQDNVLKEVNTTSVDDLISRLPGNALYAYNDFMIGIAYFKDGRCSKADFNYSVLYEEMHYKGADNEILAVSNGEEIGMIKIGDDTYVHTERKAFAKMLLYCETNEVMLCQQRRTHILKEDARFGAYGTSTETVAASLVQRTEFNPNLIDLNAYRDLKYDIEDHYLFIIKDKVVTIRSKKAFEKAFPKLKNQIKEYLAENRVNFNKPDDIIRLTRVCMSLSE